MSELITVKEACSITGFGTFRVIDALHAGKLKGETNGYVWKVDKKDLKRFAIDFYADLPETNIQRRYRLHLARKKYNRTHTNKATW